MSETSVRLSFFLGILAVLIVAEFLLPKKQRVHPRQGRWITNGILTVLNTITLNLMNITMPLLAIGAALDAGNKGWGLFNLTSLPSWLEILIAMVILDFVVWFQHLLSHKIPIMWRFHRMHHSDRDLDVTSAVRFHPIEIAFSMVVKIAVVYLLGPAAIAVIAFEIILNGMAMFNHANLGLPKWLDALLRPILVTPDMHRVHHSIYREEHDTNYGFALSIWDRMFGCYIAQPRDGHEDMKLGLQWQDDRPTKIGWSLWLPFRKL
jgi:sterol desaturase/sphingolipid hydroxylase (fatty acid hydroxylase superfamily)